MILVLLRKIIEKKLKKFTEIVGSLTLKINGIYLSFTKECLNIIIFTANFFFFLQKLNLLK